MTRIPDTFDELLEVWDDHPAPSDAQMHHPSNWTPRVLRVIGRPWSLHEVDPGVWEARHNDKQCAAPARLSDPEAFRLVCLMNEDPRAECLGRGGDVEHDPRRVPSPSLYRGVVYGLILSTPVWFAGIYAVGRLAGWW